MSTDSRQWPAFNWQENVWKIFEKRDLNLPQASLGDELPEENFSGRNETGIGTMMKTKAE